MRLPYPSPGLDLRDQCVEQIRKEDGRCPDSAAPFLPTAWLPHITERGLLFHLYEAHYFFGGPGAEDDPAPPFPRIHVNMLVESVTSALYGWLESPKELYYPHMSGAKWKDRIPDHRADLDEGAWMTLLELEPDEGDRALAARLGHSIVELPFSLRDQCALVREDWGGSLTELWDILRDLPWLKTEIRRCGYDVTAIEKLEHELDFSGEFAATWRSLLPQLQSLAEQLRKDQMMRAVSYEGTRSPIKDIGGLIHPFGPIESPDLDSQTWETPQDHDRSTSSKLPIVSRRNVSSHYDRGGLTRLVQKMDHDFHRGPVWPPDIPEYKKRIREYCRLLLLAARRVTANGKNTLEEISAELLSGTLTFDQWPDRKQRLIQIDIQGNSRPETTDAEQTEEKSSQTPDLRVDDDRGKSKLTPIEVRKRFAEITKLASHLDGSKPIQDRHEVHRLKTKLRQWFRGATDRRPVPDDDWNSLKEDEIDIVLKVKKTFPKKRKRKKQ